MASIQSRILDKVVTLLTAAAPAMAQPQPVAWRTRMDAFEQNQLPAWNVIPEDGETDPANSYSNATAHIFRFCVRCSISANNEADKAADPLFTAAMPAILTDPTLGGLVNFTRYKSQKWEMDGTGALDGVALVLTFETEFATSRTDPTVAAS